MPTRTETPDLVEHLMVLRAQLGEQDAFRGLFERYNARLLYYLRRLLSGPGVADAEDVLQEVWLTVVRKVGTLEAPEAFKAWLYRVARNRALSRLRGGGREVSLEALPAEAEIDATNPENPEQDTFAGYDPADLHAGLQRLSAAHREVLTLRFLEDLSYEEIATVVGRTVGTVRSRLHYAKKALHEILKEGHHE